MIFVYMLDFLFGYMKLYSDTPSAAADFLLKSRMNCGAFRIKDGKARFTVRRSVYKKHKDELEAYGIHLSAACGLPALLTRYRKRVGIPLGIAVFVLMLYLSTDFIWDMDISGNSELTDDEICEMLDAEGCRIGAYIPKLDLYSVCNRCILSSDKIAWISVNLKGTVAHVEVMESRIKKQTVETYPSNIVAACDGVIEYYNVYEGERMVEIGQLVRKGELLVSGLYGEKRRDSYIVHSDADIYAYTSHTLSVTVPYEYTVNEKTGKKISRKTANIFGKSLKLYINSGNLPDVCDTIDKIGDTGYKLENSRYRAILFGKIELPIIIDDECLVEYVAKAVPLDDESALSAAKYEIGKKAAEELSRAEVLTENAETEIYEDKDGKKYLRYTVEYRCIENISEQSKININGV